jgi:cardiolipin synthase
MPRLFHSTLLLSLVLLLAGCAILPDYDALNRERKWWRVDAPRVEGARGPLSAQRSAAIIRKLDEQGDTTLLKRHLAFMEAVEDIPLVAGNSARLLIDGPLTRQAMFEAIKAARTEINFEIYIFEDDPFGTEMRQLLLAKQAEGVMVNLLYDSVGSSTTPKEFFQQMRDAGIKVCEFNPINPLRARIFSPNQRDHRKMLIVDGELAITGGINITSKYARSSRGGRGRGSGSSGGSSSASSGLDKIPEQANAPGWRDTNVEIRGPAATNFRELFTHSWRKQHCPGIAADQPLPAPAPQGDKIVRVIGTSPDDDQNLIYLELLSAIDHAQKTIHVTMAYFVPDPDIIRMLADAARRGVEVKLILAEEANYRVVFYAGRSNYATLLEAGVQIYEWRDAALHAKTVVVDGVWSTVGSANLDWRSFLHNDEVNAVILGESFGLEMEKMFEQDLKRATPIDPATWQQRGWGSRLKETGARIFEYWL